MHIHSRFRFTLLAAAAGALLQVPAAAHFVWVEPADAPGAVRVCFGEYPDTREGAPLIEKIRAVHVRALGAGAVRELKQSAAADHYLYTGADAPVIASRLEYGVIQRGETPPFLLRYEGLLLRGDGKPLSPAELGRLSRIDTGMPLAVTLTPAAGGKLLLTAMLDGKPVSAEVTEAGSEQKLKTADDGRLELPLGKGRRHLRVMVQDAKPVRFEEKQGKFTRTYLSLMFDAAEEASAAAAPDAEAVRVLQAAHAARAHWGAGVPGFTADAVFSLNGRTARGKFTVGADYEIKYDLGGKGLETALRPSSRR